MSIKLYHFVDPKDYRFARAVRRGTWRPDPSHGACKGCGASGQRRVPPLVIEWLPDSDVVGDFTWPGFNDELVVSERVKESVRARCGDVEFRLVEMTQDPKLIRPRRPSVRTKPRVWLPYEGPRLWDLWPTAEVRLDPEASGLSVIRECTVCGLLIYDLPPKDQRHLVVATDTWHGAGIFRIQGLSWRFCTEEVKEFINVAGFTNVGYSEDGAIPI